MTAADPELTLADLLTCELAREIGESAISVFAPTSLATLVAALAARAVACPSLAVAAGFTVLDAEPIVAATLGEAALYGGGPTVRDWGSDMFGLLSRGRVGVAVTPAQLDAAGATNLSGIGTPGHPTVALPGAQGLPDNNHSQSRVWYLYPSHTSRQLVERVDVVCGAPPPAGRTRRLITAAGLFDLQSGGWRALWLTPGGAQLVAAAPGLGVTLSGQEPVRSRPDPALLDAVQAVDPGEVRAIEFCGRESGARRLAQAAVRERTARDRVTAP